MKTKNTTDLLPLDGEQMTSLQIAEITGKSHYHILRDIRKMEKGWEKVNETKFGFVEYTDQKGEKRPMFLLNKDECLYIATKWNDEARARLVLRWKELEMERQKLLTSKEEWNNARQIGKVQRREFTDSLKRLVEYAKENGSGNADKYYMVYSNLLKKVAGLTDGREKANTSQLLLLSYLETVLPTKIDHLIDNNLDYKSIYQEIKTLTIPFENSQKLLK